MLRIRTTVCAAVLGAALFAPPPTLAHAAGSSTTGGAALATSTTTTTTSATTTTGASATATGTDRIAARLGARVLRLGMTGADVRALQQALTAAGYPTATDGQFGPRTERHLERWQRSAGRPVTGVLSHADARALRASITMTATTAAGSDSTATIAADGELVLPSGAPTQVQEIVAAANQIITTHYAYGGGHASFTSNAYDCSGAVSFALHGAGLLTAPEDSTELESFGDSGPGSWVTVYADAAHTFLVVDGRAFDTANFGGPNIPAGTGPRWRSEPTGNLADGGNYVVRHPAGL